MQKDLNTGQWPFISAEPARGREVKRAWLAVAVSAVIFLIALPYAKTPLAQVPAFIPIYVATLTICDLITATLLFSQYRVLRMPALLVLGAGYLYSALTTVGYASIFPGLFAPTGLLGAGPQSTSAMYMFWHGGFPLFVIGYALATQTRFTPAAGGSRLRGRTLAHVLATTAAIALLAVGLLLVATLGHEHIPVFLDGNRTTAVGHIVLTSVWMLSLAALAALWFRPQHTVLDMWLLVVMSAWLFDIALAAVLNTGRYDLGWYTGRIYGLLAASFLLLVLLSENSRQFARLVRLSAEVEIANASLARLSRIDALTSVANRRSFDEYLASQLALAARQNQELCVAMLDVDHFKAFNDCYGHQAGDAVLQQIAATLQSCCRRPSDLAARYGGEEFALILPDTNLEGALHIAERVRKNVSELRIMHEGSTTSDRVTLSGGVALWSVNGGETLQQLLNTADQALYQSKRLGRNCVNAAVSPPSFG